jgi:cytochrome c-type biogenesis protein CcmH
MKQTITGKKTFLYVLVMFFVMLLPAGRVWSQDEMPSDNEVNQIAGQLYCPVCENVPLDECTTEACQAWRDLIKQQLAEGRTEQEILDYFAAQYGDKVLGEPPMRGLNWLLYIFPPLVILIGLIWIITKFGGPRTKSPDSKADDPFLSQVERDLENRRGS